MTLPMMVPADIEELAVTYLTPIMAPTPVGTRLPSPAADADTISGFLRVESAGGTQPNPVEYDLNVIVHGYSPDEVHASTIARHAVAALVAATGLTINGWFVGDTSNPVTRKSPAVTRKSHDLYIGIGFTDLRYANRPEISEVIQASVDSQVIAADSAVEGPLPYPFSNRAQARHVEIPQRIRDGRSSQHKQVAVRCHSHIIGLVDGRKTGF